jgi:chromosome segregation ATPase
MSRPVPQISSGRLVPLSVDNPNNYIFHTQPHLYQNTPAEMNNNTNNNDHEEKTMLWKNVATLFTKCEQNEDNLKNHVSTFTRGSDEMYQELQEVKAELAQVQTDITENNILSKHVRKLRKYVNKKCDKLREDISYGSSSSDNEIYAYIDTIRGEFEVRMEKLEKENIELRNELQSLYNIYDRDYDTFIKRENDLMSKLDTAIQTTECVSNCLKDHEEIYMRQLYDIRSDTEDHIHRAVGDLRDEFARAISREVEMESKTNSNLVQSVNEELIELVTRSNQYHSHRYFGMVEEVKQVREMCDTLKQSMGMVNAELSDTKETVDFLKDEVGQSSNDVYDIKEKLTDMKDDIYYEMDRDYYHMKGYVRHKIHQHNKKLHTSAPTPLNMSSDSTSESVNGIQLVVDESEITSTVTLSEPETSAAVVTVVESQTKPPEHNMIIIDADTIISDDEDEQQ